MIKNPMVEVEILKIKNSVLQWLHSLESQEYPCRWKSSKSAYKDWSVTATANVVIILDSLDLISTMKQERKKLLIANLKSFQDPETGLFKDPQLLDMEKVSTVFSEEHLWQYHTGFCAEALACLDSTPDVELPQKAFFELKKGQVRHEIMALNWNNPWLVGDHWRKAVTSYRQNNGLTGENKIDDIVKEACEVLEKEIIDPVTGFPELKGCKEKHIAMAGLFKVLFGYLEMERAFPYAKQAIDSVLAMQGKEGGFGSDDFCIHWDSMWTLKVLNQQLKGEYRLIDIAAAGEKLSHYILVNHRKSDGGFSFYKDHCLNVYTGIKVADPVPESDLQGTFMACECLRYTQEWKRGNYSVYCPTERRWTKGGIPRRQYNVNI